MTTITTRSNLHRRGFTLVEVLIGATLGTMVLVGVLSSFLMLGRSGANAANYSMMEAESRRALEELSQDLRMTKDVIWNSDQSITLQVPDNYTSTANKVTYAYDSTSKILYRMGGTSSSTEPKTTLVRDVSSCTFARFNRLNVVATTNSAIKRIQLTLVVRKKSQTVAAATNTILSASYILRNKPVN